VEGGRRSQEDREAARQARDRAREARELGLDEPEDRAGDAGDSGEGGWQRPDLGSMRRYGGGPDVFMRRRLVAIGIGVVLVLVLFMMLGGC
jgi:hypothetical protein